MFIKKWLKFGFAGLFAVIAFNAYADSIVAPEEDPPVRNDELCGVNLLNPKVFVQAGFTDVNNEGKTFKGKWKHLNRYVSHFPFGFGSADTVYKMTYKLSCEDTAEGNQYLTFKLNDGSYAALSSNGCADNSGIVSVESANVAGVELRTMTGRDAFEGEFILSEPMIVASGVDTSSFIPFKACTRVSTKTRLEGAAYGMQNRLSDVVDVITGLITKSDNTTNDVKRLVASKQNKPGTYCDPDYSSCLLVKNPSGENVWYPIEDCDGDPLLSNLGDGEAVTIGGQSYNGGLFCSDSNASALGCNTGEIVQTFHNGIVFIEEIGLNIAQGTGSIVALPANVTGESGWAMHHLCRVKGYRVKNSDGTLQARHSFDTNTWIVDDTNGGEDANCYRYMQPGGEGAMAYYSYIANSCMDNPSMASMCYINEFFGNPGQAATIYSGASTAMGWNIDGVNYQLCETLAGTDKACGNNEYVSSYSNGLAYGKFRKVAISDAVGSIVTLPNNVQNGEDACVCQVNGYSIKNGNAYSARQSFDTNLWIVVGFSGGCAEYCASGTYAQTYNEYYASISNSCADLSVYPRATVVNRGGNTGNGTGTDCDTIDSLLNPGSFVEGGETWYSKEYGLIGGKACDGRFPGIPAAGSAEATADNSCQNGEWLHVHNKVAIYGEARAVAIQPRTPGTIVTLPNGVHSGNVCVCHATAYSDVISGVPGAYNYSNAAVFSPRTAINTDKWMIVSELTAAYNGNYTPDQRCIEACGFDLHGWTGNTTSAWNTYYANIGDSCSSAAIEATMCPAEYEQGDAYVETLGTAIRNGWIKEVKIGTADNKIALGICAEGNEDYCSSNGNYSGVWVAQFNVNDPTKYFEGEKEGALIERNNVFNGVGTIFGESRCVDNKEVFGKLGSKYKVVRLSKGSTDVASSTGTVCIHNIAGYMAPEASGKPGKTTLDTNLWAVKKFDNAEACASACYNYSSVEEASWMNDVLWNKNSNSDSSLINQIGDSCVGE